MTIRIAEPSGAGTTYREIFVQSIRGSRMRATELFNEHFRLVVAYQRISAEEARDPNFTCPDGGN